MVLTESDCPHRWVAARSKKLFGSFTSLIVEMCPLCNLYRWLDLDQNQDQVRGLLFTEQEIGWALE